MVLEGGVHMVTRFLTALLTLAAAYGPAFAADPNNGKIIAQRWCATCHVVSPDQARGSADVPTFAAIAAKYRDEKSLATFLSAPYPRMPNMTLSQPEIADLVSYIRTLGPQPSQPAPLDKDDKPADPTRG
jgi:mono/diheme cytochrome c family protein